MALINFSGLASGIDSSALIEAMIEQYSTTRVKPFEDKISNLQESNEALEEVDSLITELQTAASTFRTLNGGVVAKEAFSTDETVLTAAASNAANIGTYSLDVTSLASNGVQSFDDRFTSSSNAVNSSINDLAAAADRTVSFTVGTGSNQESVDVVLSSTTSVDEFVANYNSQASKSNASVVNVGTESSPSYAIMITSGDEGTEKGSISTSVGSEILSAGAGAFSSETINQASDAQFSIDGIAGTITRGSNTVSDVVSGVSFSLQSTGSANMVVGADAETTSSSVADFVEAYNEILEYVKENDAVTETSDKDEEKFIFGSLSETSVDNSLVSSLRNALSSSGISGGLVNVLADMGITTDREGTLAFDEEIFKSALAKDPTSVETITQSIGESLSSIDGAISEYVKFGGLLDLAINVNNSQIESNQASITTAEAQIDRQREVLTQRFARLESVVGGMQSQAGLITNAIASLGG